MQNRDLPPNTSGQLIGPYLTFPSPCHKPAHFCSNRFVAPHFAKTRDSYSYHSEDMRKHRSFWVSVVVGLQLLHDIPLTYCLAYVIKCWESWCSLCQKQSKAFFLETKCQWFSLVYIKLLPSYSTICAVILKSSKLRSFIILLYCYFL